MYSLLALSTFRMLATITIIYIQNFSTFQTETQSLLNNNSSSPLSPGNFYSTFCLWTLCEFWGPHGSGIIQCLSFHGWLTSLRIMFSRFTIYIHCGIHKYFRSFHGWNTYIHTYIYIHILKNNRTLLFFCCGAWHMGS